MFQNPSSAPSSNPPSDTSSPSMRNVTLPTQQQQPHQGQSSHPPPNHNLVLIPICLLSLITMRPPQNNGQNGDPPRSPQYLRNGNGPRSKGCQNGGPPAGLSSPRLTSHPHNTQTSTMPPPVLWRDLPLKSTKIWFGGDSENSFANSIYARCRHLFPTRFLFLNVIKCFPNQGFSHVLVG